MSAKTLFDQRCWDLALYFLQDSTHAAQDVNDLAGEIQETVEDFMNAFEKAAAKKGGAA